MALPWVRLDSNFHAHDKVLALLNDESRSKWQASALYVFALGWSGGQETDGLIPNSALGMLHGSQAAARLLVKHRLWKETLVGWEIVNFADRQQLSDETYTIRKAQHIGGLKGNCIRHHGPSCGCWRTAS
jgi:DNA primase large subunit